MEIIVPSVLPVPLFSYNLQKKLLASACIRDNAWPSPFLCERPSEVGADEDCAAAKAGNIKEVEKEIFNNTWYKKVRWFLGNRLLLWDSRTCECCAGCPLYHGADTEAQEEVEAYCFNRVRNSDGADIYYPIDAFRKFTKFFSFYNSITIQVEESFPFNLFKQKRLAILLSFI